MFTLLKIVHLLSMGAGLGIGLANMIVGIRASNAQGIAVGALRQAQGAMGLAALVAVILLWITGIWLWLVYHNGALDGLFLVKIAAVILLTGMSITMNMKGAKAAKGGTPVDPDYAKRMGALMGLMSLIAVITAVMVFS